MRPLPLVLSAVLAFAACNAGAACNDAGVCPDAGGVAAASAEPAKSPAVQVAELPGNVVSVLGPGSDAATAPARLAATVSDTRPGALVMRSEGAHNGARAAKAERSRAEPGSAASEPSSVWLMLFAGLVFAGFVVAKRIRG